MLKSTMSALRTKVMPIYQSSGELCADALERAVGLITAGGLIALPTDTIYGIACSAVNCQSLDKIYEVKNRDQGKPVAICVSEIDDLYKWSKVTVDRDVLTKLLPGPVTLVFERLNTLSERLNPHTSLIGIRIPDHNFIRSLARHCDMPLALTSANISNQPSSLSPEEFKQLWPSLDAVFDGGRLGQSATERLGSTVVDLSVPGSYHVIRSGCALPLVKRVLQEANIKDAT